MITGHAERDMIVTLLLDESGSMESIRDDTIGGFNAYLCSLQAPDAGVVSFTLIKFDSNRTRVMHKGVPAQDVPLLTRETYTPGASTPLIDAACKTIKATAEVAALRPDDRVLVVFQTDGQENASNEYTLADLQHMVKEHTALGWEFVFLGAGIDAFTTGQSWGLKAAQTMSYNRGETVKTFAAMTENTRAMRGGVADAMAFSPAQRTAAGDSHHQPDSTVPAPSTAPAPEAPPRSMQRKSLVDDLDLTAVK